MKQDFIIKLQGNQHAKGRGRIVFMLLCFILALVILMIYSSKYFIALLVPVFYLILRLKSISVERTFLSDAVCTASIHDLGVVLTIESAQPKLCEIHNVLYSNTDSFTISGRKVTISYICNEKRRPYNRIVEFYILQNDIEFWNELSNAFGK